LPDALRVSGAPPYDMSVLACALALASSCILWCDDGCVWDGASSVCAVRGMPAPSTSTHAVINGIRILISIPPFPPFPRVEPAGVDAQRMCRPARATDARPLPAGRWLPGRNAGVSARLPDVLSDGQESAPARGATAGRVATGGGERGGSKKSALRFLL